MSVTERLMSAGSWTLSLRNEAPKSIRDAIKFYGHVFVFDASPGPGQSDVDMIAAARWAGVVLRKPRNGYEAGGPNTIYWLGDEDGKGPVIDTVIAGPATLLGYLNALLVRAKGVNAGTIFPVAGGATPTLSYNVMTPRAMIDHLCLIFGVEYRVNKDCTLEVGPAATLYAITPTAVAWRGSSGRDPAITDLPVTDLGVDTDAEEYVTRIDLHNAAGSYNNVNGAATPYKDLFGNLIQVTKVVESNLTPSAQGAAAAAAMVAAQQVLRRQIKLTSDLFDVDRSVRVGDNIWVFDEEYDLVDQANQVHFRGAIIQPVVQRLLSSTWPIEEGMSVWNRDGDGNWTDLTDYVAPEGPGVTLEIGAALRPLTRG